MRLLLINNNPAVSRLINLSAKKYGYVVEEFKSDDFDLNENYDVTITDNEAVSENSILLLRESGNLGDIIYVGPKGLPKPIYANYFLQKPFLPTDFVDMIKKIEKSKKEKVTEDENEKEIEVDAKDGSKEEVIGINTEDTESFVEHDEEEMDSGGMMAALDLDELDSLDLPMPDDELYNEEDKEIANHKEDEDSQKNSIEIDDITAESDIERTVDELSQEELSTSDELDGDDLELDTGDDEFSEESTSILDSEDIDEVKQLLIDDVENEETEITEEKIEDDEELIDESNDMEDAEPEKNNGFGELVQEVEDMKKPEEILQEIESIKEENVEETEEEAKVEAEEEVEVAEEEKSTEKSSIDDLMQEDLNDLFGEEIYEDEKQVKSLDTEQLKEELQTKIEEDVKKILNKDEIKEALKGLTLNISISFDEE